METKKMENREVKQVLSGDWYQWQGMNSTMIYCKNFGKVSQYSRSTAIKKKKKRNFKNKGDLKS
jgi:hypothetical protein